MRSIAIINQKGGVGKTTTAVNLAAGLTRWGSRVLLIDLDPQAHASLYLGLESTPDEPGIHSVLIDGVPAKSAIRQIDEKLHIISSHVDLVAAESELSRRPERELSLSRALAPLADDYDFIIIDSPPSLGLLTVNALAAVREVIIPVQTHFLALQGLGMLLRTATAVRDMLNPRLRVSGVILCMYEKGTRLAQEVDNDVRQFIANAEPSDVWHGGRVFDATVRRNIKLAECPSFGKTIFDYAPACNGAEDYARLAQELLEMPIHSAQTASINASDSLDTPPEEPVIADVIAQASVEAEAVLPSGATTIAAEAPDSPDDEIASPTRSESASPAQ